VEEGDRLVTQPADATVLVDVDGRVTEGRLATVSALDRGFLYGDGLYETVRAYDGHPFLLDRHLERMAASAAELRIVDGLDTQALAERVARLVEQLGAPATYIRVNLTRGVHGGMLAVGPAANPTTAIIARELSPLPDELYQRGVDVVIASIRQNAQSPVPRHKTLNYLEKLLSKAEAREQGAYEAVFVNTDGQVAEGASSNIFAVVGRRVITPPLEANILPGVTRRQVLSLAAEVGCSVRERPVSVSELRDADEVFLTNSIVELLPVCAVGGRAIGNGSPGPVAHRLLEAYRARVAAATTDGGTMP